MVDETVARREADRLRRSRALTEETPGEAAARRENQRLTAAAREGEGLAPVHNVGDFTHDCRDIHPCANGSVWLFYDGILQYAAHISKDLTGPQYFAA